MWYFLKTVLHAKARGIDRWEHSVCDRSLTFYSPITVCWSAAVCRGFLMASTHLFHALGSHVTEARSQYRSIESSVQVMGGMSYSTDNCMSLFGNIHLSANGGVVTNEWKSLRAHSETYKLSLFVSRKVNSVRLLMGHVKKIRVAVCALLSCIS